MQTDYLIVGGGLCGTLLYRSLVQAGKHVVVVDDGRPATASRVAGGVINPVTGKRLVATWLAETLLPFAEKTYREIEAELGCSILEQADMIQLHASADAALLFEQRREEDDRYLYAAPVSSYSNHLQSPFGAGRISPCYRLNVNALLHGYRAIMQASGQWLQEAFNWDACTVTDDKVQYKHITAQKMICCEGAAAYTNPYWKLLPFSLNKGEALIVRIPGLPRTHLYKHELSVVPFVDDTFWVGSSYEWTYEDALPTATFQQRALHILKHWLKLPFEVVRQVAAERPATVGQQPFLGLHPLYPAIGIMNGTGSKGCSLAPWLADNLTQHLVDGRALPAMVAVARFARLLSRGIEGK